MIKLKNVLTIGFLTVLLSLLAFSVSLWQTPQYKATAKLITVFNQTNVDTYTASKTANYITGILGEVVYSDSFIESVFKSDSDLIYNLGSNSETRQKNWGQIVKVKILDNKGVIIIDTYGNDKNQTNLLSSAVAYTIINQHGIYDGSQDRVTIKMIDAPSIYERWSTTKIIRDTLIGLLAGLLLGFTFIVIFPNHKLFELSPKKKYNYQTPPIEKTAAPQPVATPQPAPIQAAPIQYQKPQDQKPQTAPAEDYSYSQNKTQNPWLEKYYQENLPEKFN